MLIVQIGLLVFRNTLSTQISPYVSHLSLYDIAGTPGVATDISHINSKAIVKVSTIAMMLVT